MLEEREEDALLRITKTRLILSKWLETNFITEQNIISALQKDTSFMLTQTKDYKMHILQDIVNSPFILCDQSSLSLNMKKILPIILKTRCDQEIDELNKMYELGYIDESELAEELKFLKFIYYESSQEGSKILADSYKQKKKVRYHK